MSQKREAGFTMLEAAVSMTVLAVALLSLWQTLIYCSRSNLAAEQRTRAVQAAQAKIEEMKSQPFSNLISLYGPSGTIGDTFGVPTIDANLSQAKGLISFYVDETQTDAGMGLPMDLDGDGDETDTDVSGNYELLPVKVTIEWTGPLGPQKVDLRAILREES